MDGGYETLWPEEPSPFFTVKVAMLHDGEHAGGWTVQYLRAANLIRAQADYGKHVWTRPAGVTAAALRDAARGLQPYTRPRSSARCASRRPWRSRTRRPGSRARRRAAAPRGSCWPAAAPPPLWRSSPAD